MKNRIDLLLKMTRWKLFFIQLTMIIIFIIVPFLIQEFINNSLFVQIFVQVFALIFLGLYMIWYWNLGIMLSEKLTNIWNSNVKLFKIFFTLSYLSIIYQNISPLIFKDEPIILFVISGLLGIISTFYWLWYIDKSIRCIESGKNETVLLILNYDIMLLFLYPIGVWILQPKINRIFKEK